MSYVGGVRIYISLGLFSKIIRVHLRPGHEVPSCIEFFRQIDG